MAKEEIGRNMEIYSDHIKEMRVIDLSKKYNLSPSRIVRIIQHMDTKVSELEVIKNKKDD